MKEFLTINPSLPPPPYGEIILTGVVGQNLQWMVPPGVSIISVLCVGVGSMVMSSAGLEGGGGLSYRNNFPVIPGEILLYDIVGAASTLKYNSILRKSNGEIICQANSGITKLGGKAAFEFNDGGGNGGSGDYYGGGGGGAGGYTGNGGNGGFTPSAGQGGGGGGGRSNSNPLIGGTGGGVGLFGQGNNGAPGTSDTTLGRRGSPGSGGSGVTYGGGSFRYGSGGGNTTGGAGAIRIIWGPEERAFPSTNVQNSILFE